ncbi:MAG: acyl-CoA synthetase [Alphaproteobacteria bacterium]|nr:acyl-CoA synthetase [Alphaproteobacteria bacterium]
MTEQPVFAFWQRTDRDAIAVVDPDHTVHTVGALQDAANQLAHGLRALGLGHGDVLAFCLHNAVEVYEVWMAATQIGLRVVPLNWHLTASEVAYIVEDSGAKVVVADLESAPLVADCVAHRFVAGGEVEGFRPLSALKTGDVSPPAHRTAGGVMNYTSGTTGRPKGVRRPLPETPPEPVATAYAYFLLLFGMQPGRGVQIVGSPLYHTAVLYFSSSALHLGHSLVLMDKWTPEGMLERIARYRVTSSHMVPTQFSRLLAVPDRERFDVSSLRAMVHSAAPCPPAIKQQMLDWWGDAVWEYYAATEGGGTAVSPQEWRLRPGTVGRPWQGADIKVFRDDGTPCGPGEVGTVYIKMAQGFEYHQDKRKTEEAWRPDGYFTVGDAGYLDEEGYLFLSDRKADMIISGGVNIYPAEIEAVLITHPAVLDVAVFGIPDDDWGEQVKAVIELTAGTSPGDAVVDDILAFAEGRLAKFKRPRSIDLVDALPRDPNGKLAKRKLRDPYWEGTGRAI